MKAKAQRASLFALYQLSIAAGIALLPIALAVRRVGVSLPVHRLVKSIEASYEETTSETNA